MPTSRRKFLKLCAALGTTAAIATVVPQLATNRTQKGSSASTNEEEGDIPQKWVMLIDLELCDGCVDRIASNPPERKIPACLEGCAMHHRVPMKTKSSGGLMPTIEFVDPPVPQPWIEVFEKEDNPVAGPYYLPRPCMHCQSAPCVHVCPTGASFKDVGGLTHIDHRICIGCRMCMAACPYNARSFNWREPVPWNPPEETDLEKKRAEEIAFAESMGGYSPQFPVPSVKGTPTKCDFCQHAALKSNLPACVTNCPKGALYYGDLNQNAVTNFNNGGVLGAKETIPISKTITSRSGYRLHEELGTNPKVFYLPKRGSE